MATTQNQIPHLLNFDLRAYMKGLEVPATHLVDLKKIAKRLSVFPLKLVYDNDKPRLLLAMQNTNDLAAIAEVEFAVGMPVIAYPVSELDMRFLIFTYYTSRSNSAEN